MCLPIAAMADVAALLSKGDALDAKHQNAGALELFLEADAVQPNDAAILRRIAKQYSQMITEASQKQEKIRLGESALEFATRAVALDPDNADGRLTLAIAYGRVALHESPRKRLEYSRRLQSEAEAAIVLDPRSDYAWHVLGRWNYEIATLNLALRAVAQVVYGKLPDASLERAAECFEQAIEAGPPRVIHHVELGRTYLALDRKDDAKVQFEKGLALPTREKDDVESKALARKALDSQ